MNKIKVIIADDHDLFRECLYSTLEREDHGISVVGHVKNGNDLINLARKVKCDLILLDIIMPGSNSLDILKTLKAEFPIVHVLVLSGQPEYVVAPRYLKAGASGFFSKGDNIKDLFPCIRKVFNGHIAISQETSERLALESLQPDKPVSHEVLSDREYQVMCLMSSGKTLSEVADELCLSPKTVSTYRNNIMEKMGWKNNAQMMSYCLSHKLCEPHLEIDL